MILLDQVDVAETGAATAAAASGGARGRHESHPDDLSCWPTAAAECHISRISASK